MSQSLLHQVTYSDWQLEKSESHRRELVSIPFTSGHVFRPGLIRALRRFHSSCLNPFYIRSRIPTPSIYHANSIHTNCLNPFYIRSRIPTAIKRDGEWVPYEVSIPFTSGHVFRPRELMARALFLLLSQSLLHQVTYSDEKKMAVIIVNIDVSIPFTSGHVFRRRLEGDRSCSGRYVSIPFTSGHVFRHPATLEPEWIIKKCLNPFYIRSRIPTCCGKGTK